MARQFHLDAAPCNVEDLAGDRPQALFLRLLRDWFDELDQRTPVNHVRQLLQAHYAAAEENLRAFALRLLRKPRKSNSDRDKVDFVTVQYFAACAPQEVATKEVTNEDVAQVLAPLLGRIPPVPAGGFAPLEKILAGIAACQSLRELLESKLLDQGRKLKDSVGEKFYQPLALIAFCRFNFLVRRAFIRLSHADLRATRDALCQLETCGVQSVDCQEAGLGAAEPIAELHEICRDWKHPFRAEFSEYTVSTSLRRLIALRAAAEQALAGVQGELAEPSVDEFEPALNLRKTQPAPGHGGKPEIPFRSALAAEEPPARPAAGISAAAANVTAALKRAAAPMATTETAPAGQTAALSTDPAPATSSSNPALNQAASTRSPAPAEKPAATPKEITEAEIDGCSEKIWEQLISAPPGRGRSMSTVTVGSARLLLSSWEVAAFVSEGGQTAQDIRRAVAVRALLAVALDAHTAGGDPPRLAAALELAANEMNRLQGCVERAKSAKQTEGAVNLSMTAKRLLAFIEQAEDLRG
jgi:hypothetical protein